MKPVTASAKPYASPPEEAPAQPETALFADRAARLWWALLILLFAGGLAVRLYDLGAPPVDFHPTRQIHSALIARGMYYAGQEMIPEWQRDMAVRQWQTEGVIEPQVFERLVAWTYERIGAADLRAARLYAILFWMAAGLLVTRLALEMAGRGGALVAALFFLAWPYGVIASRAFQPEPLLIALCAGALLVALRWQERGGWGLTLAAGLLAGLAIYIKAVAVFFVGPPLVVLALSRGGLRAALRDPRTWALALLALLPYAAYHIDGTYLRGYLVGQLSLRFFPEMWPAPAFYLRWISNLERVLPVEMALAALFGAFTLRRPLHRAALLSLWVGYLLYGMTLPHHISTHDYYHLPLFPAVALGLAGAGESLLAAARGPRVLVRAALAAVLGAALVLNLYEARTAIKRSGAHELAQSWEEIGQELGPSASVLALVDDYGVGLKYYAWMMPEIWPTADDIRFREETGQGFDFAGFFESQAADKDFFVVAPPDELERQPSLSAALVDRYPVYRQADQYLIFDLRAASGRQGAP